MPTNVDVPALGESVREAVLIKWHKNDGDTVVDQEPIAELETDKANVDVPAPAAGVLRRVKSEGDTVAIGDTIARIDEGGSNGGTAKPQAAKQGSGAGASEAKNPPSPGGAGYGGQVAAPTKPASPPVTAPAATSESSARGTGDLRPSVRRIVEEKKLNPADLKGTGPGGKVTKEDAARLAASMPSRGGDADEIREDETRPLAPPTPAIGASPEGDGVKRVPMTRIRKKIAERLVQAQQTAAILTTFNEVDMQAIFDLRAKYKEKFEKLHGVGLGFMSFFARAVVLALREFPRINAQIDGDDVVYHSHVNLGIAVSTDRGLAVPVLRHVERLGFAQIESEIKRLALATREGKLGLQELSGGTFTITNGGVFGSLLSTPIINPPQSGILGMHAIQKRAVVVNDQIVIRPMMYVALSYDHRLVDGKESVSFLVRMKEYLEDPARLMLEV
ncbi:MAG TPA: 2-oxoglutarate dehydrogenase complex dihydrolipoyllysine-residue succinyltransferase [Tepidisphaeraceae bacterium]|nr:2-oxoglutarate dehydrogenase complex dihydrolipoyllysine-residue succinyltransferase [Tepidisphaeraceae bacterium]